MNRLYDGDTFKLNGAIFRVTMEHDSDHGAPWKECDGHGVVTEYQRGFQDRRGFWEMATDRGGGFYYNWLESLAIAKRDGWGLAPEELAKLAKRLGRAPSARDIRKEAVRRDFEYLRGWCSNDWEYVVIGVTLLDCDGAPTGETEYLGGVESEGSFASESAYELAGDILHRLSAAKDEAEAMGG